MPLGSAIPGYNSNTAGDFMSEQKKLAYLVSNDLVTVDNQLFPITHSFIVKPSLERFQGNIMECYNCLPPSFDMEVGPTVYASFRIACAYINFTSVTRDTPWGLDTVQDEYGFIFNIRNSWGLWPPMRPEHTWLEHLHYQQASSGATGAVIGYGVYSSISKPFSLLYQRPRR